ncbi:hypothetical protein KKD52_09670 [Myxococcota bacterium]|nr:hypothetical protein [Myxococcota bacterium]MBU1510616.1 hypothetical protein [Myxococcota bacterium]
MNRTDGLRLLIIVPILWIGCSKPNHYKNASLQRMDDALYFRGDETCAYAPMPYNTEVDFASFGKRWGFAWMGVYRDAGLSAINRTTTLSVLYLAGTDAQLNPITRRPHRVAILKRDQIQNPEFKVLETLHGVSVAYTVAEGDVRCAELNLKVEEPLVHSNVCRLRGTLLKGGPAMGEWAIRHFLAYTYALMVSDGIRIVRSADPEKQEEMARIPGTEGIRYPVLADLLVGHSRHLVVWAGGNEGCRTVSSAVDPAPECAPWKVARFSPGKGAWKVHDLPVRGALGHQRVRLFEGQKGPFVLLQMGTRVVRVPLEEDTGAPGEPVELVDLKVHGKATDADFMCVGDDCWIRFARNATSSYLFTVRSGLQVRKGLNYPIRCGAPGCVEERESGVGPLYLKP